MAVYFIRSADVAVKTGRANDVKKRLANLQTAHAYELTLLHLIEKYLFDQSKEAVQEQINNLKRMLEES